jgi:tetratricopeptide (TPR) repeat protein
MRKFLLIILLLPIVSFVSGQTMAETRESFEEGKFFFARGDYQEAAYYFRKVVDSNPDNAHFNFLLGECYMNIPGEETLAVPHFLKATKKTTAKNKYRAKDFEESSAPLHAWFYLGNVYRIANRLEDALMAYDTFVRSPFYYGNYNVNIVENEIKSCERAKIILDRPVEFVELALDTMINTSASEIYPVVSADGQSMAFIRRLKFYDAIFFVTKNGDSWSQPVNLNPLILSDGDFYPVCLSGDGYELYLVKKSLEGSDLYVSHRNGVSWSKAEPLSKFINSRAYETSACISLDKQTLWFTSSRKGGSGGFDIYYSARDKNGQWGRPKNAGKIINTPFDEESPHLCIGDKTLFFSSKGHYSMGGYDIFHTSRNGKTWGDPVNIGFPVNNTADNIGFVPLSNGTTGYISRINRESGTSEDIFRVTLKSNLPSP